MMLLSVVGIKAIQTLINYFIKKEDELLKILIDS